MIRISNLLEGIEIGKRIKIVKSGKNDEYLASQILDIVGKDHIVISGPIKKSDFIFIHKDELIELYYTVENKGIFSFTSKVISREISPVYTLKIEKVSEIVKVQQREHFRLLIGLELEKEHEIYVNNIKETYIEKCEAKDISGGGLRIYCNYKHNLNDKIRCLIKIENKNININAIVKRIDEIDTFDFEYSLGVSFLEIEELSRDTIIRYIFEKQRILRNKGLI